MPFLVHINERRYLVADDSVADIESRVLEAVHSGGGFVEIRDGDARPVKVLITTASHVRIEPEPQPIPVDDEDGDMFPDFISLDLGL